MKMYLRKATVSEKDTVWSLYKSVIGENGCAWDESYPGKTELQTDFETENIYVYVLEERIIGAVSVIHKNELDGFDFWQVNDGNQKEFARVVIDKRYQGNGYAAAMVGELISLLKKENCSSLHILVAKCNTAAQKTYQKLGFQIRGECKEYGIFYYACELVL